MTRSRVLWGLALLSLFALTAAAHAAILACHGDQSFDNAVAVQFMHLATRGWGPSGVVGASAFGDHFNPLFLLPLPLFALWPGALTLQLFKSAVYVGSLAGLALLARDMLGKRSAFWVVLAVVLSPMLWVSLLADYHSETVAAGLIPWMLLAYQRERLGLCLLAAAGVALGKENLPLVVGGLGVLALFEGRSIRWVAGLGLLGGVVFIIGFGIVIPSNAPVEGNVGSLLYSRLGTLAGWREVIADPSVYRWLGFLLLSCGGLCLLAPRKLWPLTPLLLQHGLSARAAERLVDFHYLAPILPLLAYAALAGAARLGVTPVVVDARRKVAAAGLVAINLALLLSVGFHHDPRSDRGPGPFARLLALEDHTGVADLAARIPADAPAWASLSTATRIARRDHLFMIESLTLDVYLGRTWAFRLPDADPAFGLIDVRDPHVPAGVALDAVDAVGDVVLLAPAGPALVRPLVGVDTARWARAAGLRFGAGQGGAYRVAIDPSARKLPPMVLLVLMRDGRVVDRRGHRLLYGLTDSALFGVYATRYRHPYVLAHPGRYELYARLPGTPSPVLLTTYGD